MDNGCASSNLATLSPSFLSCPPPSCCQRDRTCWHFGHQEKPRLNYLRDAMVQPGWIAFDSNFKIKIKIKIK